MKWVVIRAIPGHQGFEKVMDITGIPERGFLYRYFAPSGELVKKVIKKTNVFLDMSKDEIADVLMEFGPGWYRIMDVKKGFGPVSIFEGYVGGE